MLKFFFKLIVLTVLVIFIHGGKESDETPQESIHYHELAEAVVGAKKRKQKQPKRVWGFTTQLSDPKPADEAQLTEETNPVVGAKRRKQKEPKRLLDSTTQLSDPKPADEAQPTEEKKRTRRKQLGSRIDSMYDKILAGGELIDTVGGKRRKLQEPVGDTPLTGKELRRRKNTSLKANLRAREKIVFDNLKLKREKTPDEAELFTELENARKKEKEKGTMRSRKRRLLRKDFSKSQ